VKNCIVKRKSFFLASLPALLGLILWSGASNWGVPGTLLQIYTEVFFLVVFLVLATRGLRIFLWRVSRRLAFSYFLFGIVPITLLLLLCLVAGYFLSGFLLGHLYHDHMYALAEDLQIAARDRLQSLYHRDRPRSRNNLPIAFAFYKNGKRFTGTRAAPPRWQEWWPTGRAQGEQRALPLLATEGGKMTLMGAAREGPYGVVALWKGDVGREVADRSGIWVEFSRPEDREMRTFELNVFLRRYALNFGRGAKASAELEAFLKEGVEEPGWLDRPWLVWVEIWRPFIDLGAAGAEDGPDPEAYIYANLTSSLRVLGHQLFSRSAEIDLLALVALTFTSFLLFAIYVLAALLALVMITGLSRAVNRLTEFTHRVQEGDFSARIVVQRKDQIGALQTSFNTMAENLHSLVDQAAQKEILEKDLLIAQELQHSLLPDTLTAPQTLRFATHFEPCSAIGGDYYDLLNTRDGRLAVVVADVAGHGISAGLRMAMVKSTLQVLCEHESQPEEMLRQVHRFLRKGVQKGQRSLVTMTLVVIDPESGELTIFNAGHPPTYLLRRGTVREILLPSLPLGSFGEEVATRYGRLDLALEPDDVVLWLSDGLVEAVNRRGEAFGYDRVMATLEGIEGGPEKVRGSLLAAVQEHTGDTPLEDDRTVVVMAYRIGEGEQEPS
jgi:serine phosphatase RsbU (regulator of sigma subunit)